MSFTADAECIHGMEPDWCSLCKVAVATSAQVPIVDGPTVRARYAGQCGGCNLPLRNGELIQHWTDGQWRHEGCTP